MHRASQQIHWDLERRTGGNVAQEGAFVSNVDARAHHAGSQYDTDDKEARPQRRGDGQSQVLMLPA